MEFALHKDIEVIKKTLLAATLLAATGAAHAGFVEYDWETAGDGRVSKLHLHTAGELLLHIVYTICSVHYI